MFGLLLALRRSVPLCLWTEWTHCSAALLIRNSSVNGISVIRNDDNFESIWTKSLMRVWNFHPGHFVHEGIRCCFLFPRRQFYFCQAILINLSAICRRLCVTKFEFLAFALQFTRKCALGLQEYREKKNLHPECVVIEPFLCKFCKSLHVSRVISPGTFEYFAHIWNGVCVCSVYLHGFVFVLAYVELFAYMRAHSPWVGGDVDFSPFFEIQNIN